MAKTSPLTSTEVKAAKPRKKLYKLADGNGLQLRITPTGGKAWLLDYVRPVTNKRTTLGLGSYPETTLAQAREKTRQARKLLVKGIDPKEQKDKELQESKKAAFNTLEQVAAKWHLVKKTKVSNDHANDIWRSLEIHIFPLLGKIAIAEITAPQSIEALSPLVAKGSLETVKRVSQRLNEIMAYAVNTGVIHSNPLAGIKAAFESPVKKNMPTITPEQLPELMKAISYASIKIVTRCLIEWQLHTMVRPSEASGAKWCEIDLKNNLWLIPAERMKKKREHTVPLTKQTLELLERLKPLSGHSEYLFPADRDHRKHTNEQTANAALKRMGYHKKLVAHGMRALASTTLNSQGFDGDVIEAALAHVDKNEVRRVYNRTNYLERRRTLMAWWSEHIEQAANGKQTTNSTVKHLKAV